MTDEQLFLLRFNFPNMLRQAIDPCDSERIANVLGLLTEETKAALESFDAQNEQAARKIADAPETEKFKDKKARIVFIGDSITSDRLGFFNILRKVFDKCGGIELLDSSVSGWRSGDVLQDLYGSVLAKEPDMVVFTVGTNDLRTIGGKCNVTSRQEYERNIKLLFDALRDYLLIVNTLPPFHTEKLKETYGSIGWSFKSSDLQTYNGILRENTRKYGAVLNDTCGEFQNAINAGRDVFHGDGLHLNGAGQSIIARSLFAVLNNLWSEDGK